MLHEGGTGGAVDRPAVAIILSPVSRALCWRRLPRWRSRAVDPIALVFIVGIALCRVYLFRERSRRR